MMEMTTGFRGSADQPSVRPLGIWLLMICNTLVSLFVMAPSAMIVVARGDDIPWTPSDRILALFVVVLCVLTVIASVGTWSRSVMFRNLLLALLVVLAVGMIWNSYATFVELSQLGYRANEFGLRAWWDLSLGVCGAFLLCLNWWYLLRSRSRDFFVAG
jgi:hypothetical protein